MRTYTQNVVLMTLAQQETAQFTCGPYHSSIDAIRALEREGVLSIESITGNFASRLREVAVRRSPRFEEKTEVDSEEKKMAYVIAFTVSEELYRDAEALVELALDELKGSDGDIEIEKALAAVPELLDEVGKSLAKMLIFNSIMSDKASIMDGYVDGSREIFFPA